jgi:putative membrane protein
MILYLKAFHIVGFVAWFAGLFYLVRMFVYSAESMEKEEPERTILSKQFILMEWRVYKIICNPAMVLTWACGLGMLFLYGTEWLAANPWMHIKLTLLVLMTGYHHFCKRVIKKIEKGETTFNSFQFRLLNELPTLFLISIVLLAVLKNSLNFLYAFLGVLLFGFLLFIFAKMYKKHREKNKA